MTLDLSDFLDALHHTLSEDVLPHVTQDHARGQLRSSIDVIEKLSGLAAWSADLMAEQSAALASGIARLGGPAAGEVPTGPQCATTSVERQQADLAAAIDGYFESGRQSDVQGLTERAIRHCLLDFLAAERTRIAAADYSAMK